MDNRLKRILLNLPKENIYGFFEYLSPAQQEGLFKEFLSDPIYARKYMMEIGKCYLEGMVEDEHGKSRNFGFEAGSGEYPVDVLKPEGE